ncbi:hypothetical protein X943_001964 [Babesia divergens]|uniref:Uncharacterized protein n=1 Tax=Babesia divergens TaxID=32595 RepID=A0AAD9GFG2_BABDI|nr:hypothetical protein X943_001964 [Babesia divergens]
MIHTDTPLVLEELETPHDRASVLNDAVHYLAGTGSARYPLSYSSTQNDETFFNCVEGDCSRSNNVKGDDESDCNPSAYCGSETDSDLEYVKNICRKGSHTKERHTNADGFNTPYNASLTRESDTRAKTDASHKAFYTPRSGMAWRYSFSPSWHADDDYRQGDNAITTGEYEDIDSHLSGQCDDVTKNASGAARVSIPPLTDRNPHYGKGNSNGPPNYLAYIHNTADDAAKSSTTVSGIRKGSVKSGMLVPAEGRSAACDVVTENCDNLLTFAKDFRQKYGGDGCSESLNIGKDEERDSKNWSDVYKVLDAYRPTSWESTEASISYTCDKAHNNTAVGGLLFGYIQGSNNHGVSETMTQPSKVKEGSTINNRTKQLSSTSNIDNGKVRLSGQTQTNDILLREYRSSNVSEARHFEQRDEFQLVRDETRVLQEPSAESISNEYVNGRWPTDSPQNGKTKKPYDSAYEGAIYKYNHQGTPHTDGSIMPKSQMTTGRVDVASPETREGITMSTSRDHSLATSGGTVTLVELNQHINEFFNARGSPSQARAAEGAPSMDKESPALKNFHMSSYVKANAAQSQKSLTTTTARMHGNASSASVYPSTSTSTLGVDLKRSSVTTKDDSHRLSRHGCTETPILRMQPMSNDNSAHRVDIPQHESKVIRSEKTYDSFHETLQHKSDTKSTELKISLIGDMLNAASEQIFNIGTIAAKNSGDLNLYDSTCVVYPDIPYREDNPVREAKPSETPDSLHTEEVPYLIKLDTQHEVTPGSGSFDDNMPTKTNYMEPDDQIGLPSQPSMISFGDEMASYIPGTRLDEAKNKAVCGSDLFDDVKLQNAIKAPTGHVNTVPPCRHMELDLSVSEGAFTQCVDNAPRNRGYRYCRSADSKNDMYTSRGSLNTSGNTFGEVEQHHSKEIHCQSCKDLVLLAEPVDDRCCSKVLPISAMRGRTRARRLAKGRITSRRRTYDELMDQPVLSSSHTHPFNDRVLIPSPGLRSYRDRVDVVDSTMRHPSDIFSEVSSDYVHLPSDEMSYANGGCDFDSDFSGSEGYKDVKKELSSADGNPYKELLNPMEEMLTKHLESGYSFEDFVSLVKRLYVTLEEKHLVQPCKASELTSATIKGNRNANRSNIKSAIKAPIKLNASLDSSSNLDTVRTSKSTTRCKKPSSSAMSAATQTDEQNHPLFSCDVKGTKAVSFSVQSPVTASDSHAMEYDSGKGKNQDATVVRKGRLSMYNDAWRVPDRDNVVSANPLTKEAIIARVVSAPACETTAAPDYKKLATVGDVDLNTVVRRYHSTPTKLPDGITQEQLLDVYNEVMKLTRIFHVKDVKSLTRAVTARVQNRTI